MRESSLFARHDERGQEVHRLVHHAEVIALKGDSYRLCSEKPDGTLYVVRQRANARHLRHYQQPRCK